MLEKSNDEMKKPLAKRGFLGLISFSTDLSAVIYWLALTGRVNVVSSVVFASRARKNLWS